MSKKNNSNKEQKVWINFQSTESFKKSVQKYSDNLSISQSDFIRQAIREKIERIDNPNNSNSKKLDYNKIETIIESKLEDKQIESKLSKLMEEREKDSNILKELREMISNYTTIEGRQVKTQIIVDLLKKSTRTIKEIMDATGFNKETVLSIINDLEKNSIIKFNTINGKVEYIE